MGGVLQLVKTSAWTGAAYSHGGFLQVSVSDALLEWLIELALLKPVPLHYLVPDPALLPLESLRLVSLEPALIGRLLDGALAAAALGGGDLALGARYRAGLFSLIARELTWRGRNLGVPLASLKGIVGAGSAFAQAWADAHDPPRPDQPPFEGAIAGVLIRSELVHHYPSLVVRAAAGGQALGCVRCDRLAPTILLALFHGPSTPDRIELQEPDLGTRFGVEPAGQGFEVDYRRPNGRLDGMLSVPVRAGTAPAETVLDLGALITDLGKRQQKPADSTSVARCLQQAPFVHVIGDGARPVAWKLEP